MKLYNYIVEEEADEILSLVIEAVKYDPSLDESVIEDCQDWLKSLKKAINKGKEIVVLKK